MQKRLSQTQQAAFYHDEFAALQLRHFQSLCDPGLYAERAVVDVGGGEGHFAQLLGAELGVRVRVLDIDPVSVASCVERGIEARVADALQPPRSGDEGVVCFNLILHHLVGARERDTERLQSGALRAWREGTGAIFVNKYIYDSYLGDLSARLIYLVTRSRLLSRLAAAVSRLAPSLRANTFGVGVRFRSDRAWREFFRRHGLEVRGYVRGFEETVSLPRRLLLIRSCRKDSYLLGAAAPTG